MEALCNILFASLICQVGVLFVLQATTVLSCDMGVSLKHDGTVKMANLPVRSVCETVTDYDRQTDCPVCRLSVTTGRRLLKHDGKMAHLTGQNGLSDVTGKRLLKHDWTDRKWSIIV